ncbi:uncharacterized protein BDR25DRAFT_95732 [Lindgomyces ingoldianus]|uniref:Uncharacterized protein n=1 Tax=Lindgomyces ingoldianus TaxID=673940 RepID=A0ACB6QCJ3_9PLEO|nr:uncharacterized protein BDR25DRAFT_95732 [Lindgomyces ingoldianus]KAF2464580.1 hypothetical protein BDR25DRAFT_95732 [Lindgomyces ingoldianus]
MPLDTDDLGEVPQASSSSNALTQQPRVRRRARKRNGPPQLQFLTATDPSQFKDENAKRSVRSQAMIQYRYRAEQQKQKGKEPSERSPVSVARPPVAERIAPVVTNEPPWQSRPSTLMARVLDAEQEQEHLYSSTSAAWMGLNIDEGLGDSPRLPSHETSLTLAPSSRYHRALSVIPLHDAAQKISDYEDSDKHEDTLMRMLCAKLATVVHLGDGVDPFSVIPQFESPELDSLYLVRKCNRAFVSKATMVKWMPSMLAHPHSLLSSTILASTYLDMHAGCSGDSKRTVLVKGEVIGWINERLRNAETQFSDLTLTVILHLLAGEMWSCNEKTLRIHESGVARLILQRGGMESLGGNGALGEVAAACCFHTDIFCEATPHSIFQCWEPTEFAPVEDSAAIPESPLFCPRSEFFTIARSQYCSETTFDLLCDMRDLTDLFVSYHGSLDTALDVESPSDRTCLVPSSSEYDTKVSAICARLAALPSAYTPGIPITNDWVYETCRIASIIYASAILYHIPFSVASEPGRSPLLSNSVSLTNSTAGGHLLTTRLTDALYETLEKTNLGDVWGGMSGVLYWVTLVGAAAARTPVSVNMTQTPKSRTEAYATWVRRCLIMFATRAMIVLVFEHPLPVIMAQRKMLKVQELTGSAGARRLVP